jgi:hypothetical protein
VGGVYWPGVLAKSSPGIRADGGRRTTVDGSLGGGLLALVLSTLPPLAGFERLGFVVASADFW